jgi:PAS domain S-box-containing protein
VPGQRGALEAQAGLRSDHLAALAAAACGAPLGGVTLVETEGPRVDAAHGFDALSPPPIAALCDRVLRERRLVVVHGYGASGSQDDDAPVGLFAGVPILTRCGKSLGVLWVADVSARAGLDPEQAQLLSALAGQLAAQDEVRTLRQEREQALEMVGAAIFYASPDGMLTQMSSSWEMLTGHPLDATVKRPLTDFVQGDVEDHLGAVLAGPASDAVRRFDCTVVDSGGTAVPVELALTRSDRAGAAPVVLGVLTDLRERHRRELAERHDLKMESLGRLSAGIAHEINTPIQFVGDNTRFLASAYEEMLALLLVYRECMDVSSGEVSWDERLQRAADAEREADIDYLTVEVPAAVAQSLEGIDRVASLVRAMKSFSYKDSSDRSYADLNEALTTTLTVARNETKYVADVVLDLGDLPEVLCHVGDLNQVFLNLVVNAADALHDRDQRGEIRITTRAEESMAVVTIADNGPGIPKELQCVIFEPFFTTKGVGKGTGQGLALARAVADKHGGTIEVHSEPGEGTEFVLRLPVDGKRSGAA